MDEIVSLPVAQMEKIKELEAELAKARAALEVIRVETAHPYGQQSSVWEQLIVIGKIASEALNDNKDK